MRTGTDNVVFTTMSGRSRIVERGGDYLVQTLQQGRSDRWLPAPVEHAAGVLKIAYAISLLKEGDAVVYWEGSRHVLGAYVGRAYGEHLVDVDKRLVTHVLPVHLAVKDGTWPFVDGLDVVALVDGAWVRATWRDYQLRSHIVERSSGERVQSERAHEIQKAIRMGLLDVPHAGVLPQQRPRFREDLKLLTAGMHGEGYIRAVAENGVMVRFTAFDCEFEGLALFNGMGAPISQKVTNGVRVSFEIVNARHANWGIPQLKLLAAG